MNRIKIIISAFLASACATRAPEKPESFWQVQLPASKSRDQYESVASKAMVSTQGIHTTQAGIEVLKKGGNLFDAFTAISFAIGVERPHSTGIGGGGFLVFYDAREKKVYALDFREMAPQLAHGKMFLDEKNEVVSRRSLTGALAVATPGLVAGVLEVHKKYGRLPLSETLKPAIQLAENGFSIYPALARALLNEEKNLGQFPSSRKIFFSPQGKPWPQGHILVQKDLARTMNLIAQQGAQAFYQGEIAQKIAATMTKHKGLLSPQDLADYKTKWRRPVHGRYKDFDIYSHPPPSSGGTHIIQILNILEKDNLAELGPQHPQSIHLTASAMQRSFYDRARFMGDPDFVSVPVDRLLSKEYAQKIRARISAQKVSLAEDLLKEESLETTHFSLMDEEGNILVSTQTINGHFGSALVAEGTGIVLNNEMDDFAAKEGALNMFGAVGGKNNLVQGGKRPLSSMSPTIVLKNQMPVLALGTPSGTRIITCVAQTLLNVLEYQLPLWNAVALTRYHQQWQPDQLHVESPGLPNTVIEDLRKRGHQVVDKPLGCQIQAIQKEGSQMRGVSDPREEGSSQGL